MRRVTRAATRTSLRFAGFALGGFALAGLALATAGCTGGEGEPGEALLTQLAAGRWVDLSHEFSAQTLYWPTEDGFRFEVLSAGRTPAGYYYASDAFAAASHGGTHIDAPLHFAQGRHSVEQIPLEQG